jgi:hypothetical protein
VNDIVDGDQKEVIVYMWNCYPILMKFCRAISRVKLLNGEKTNVSKAISVFVLRVLIWI